MRWLGVLDLKTSHENRVKSIKENCVVYKLVGIETPLPLESIKELMEKFENDKELVNRAKSEFTNYLIYKDSKLESDFKDEKKVLDISDKETDDLNIYDFELINDLGENFHKTMQYFGYLKEKVVPILVADLKKAGDFEINQDEIFNFRLIDYYASSKNFVSPRCSEHRDFSTLTIIHSDNEGLEVEVNGDWKQLEVEVGGNLNVFVIFGICSSIRSNDRIHAVKHRVVNRFGNSRRLSAVTFLTLSLFILVLLRD